jgi:hypothetical protein
MEFINDEINPFTRKYRIQNNIQLHLINSLEKPFISASMSIYDVDSLFSKYFYSENHHDEIGIPVLKQNLNSYKIFFKKLKRECIITEFLFGLNEIKNRMKEHHNKILESAFRDEYFSQYTFDYYKIVIFIERYIAFCKVHIPDIIYQYSFDMQKELFYGKNDLEKRMQIIKNHLSMIYFNEKYDKVSNGCVFGGNDFGIIYAINQNDTKKFFESEILKEEYQKLKDTSSDKKEYFIDTSIDPIVWNGTPTELIELIKALIENRSIKGDSQKKIISSFTKFLNIDIKHPDKLIQDIRKRNNKSETLFLDKLQTTLYDYISK